MTTSDGRRRYKSRRQRGYARSRVLAVKNITRDLLRRGEIDVELAGPPVDVPRPIVREDCRGDERPCPWVSCRHHLFLDVDPETGSIKFNFPELEPWELQHSCSLDIAERGGVTLDVIAEILNLTRERIRQIEFKGSVALRARAIESGVDAESLAAFPHPEGNQHPDAVAYSDARVESNQRARDAYVERQRAKAEADAPTEPKED